MSLQQLLPSRMCTVVLTAAALASACAREADTPARARLRLTELLGGADTLFERATEPRAFSFPLDHGPHRGFRSEWWYFTGNLATDDGRRFGYQLTFFRSALAPDTTAPAAGARSSWRARDIYMAHLAVSDIDAERFRAAERFGRAALGLAGATAEPWHVWIADWTLRSTGASAFPVRLNAGSGDIAIDLVLDAGKPIVLQGERGLSRKGPEPGNASHYYSLTRMPTTGSIRSAGRTYRVTGTSWLDREWSTSALGRQLEGWDWFALQLDDGSDLMLYRLRRADGTADPFSAGTLVAPDGTAQRLTADEFRLTPVRWWQSALDETRYPVEWRIDIPSAALELVTEAAFAAQELDLAVRYWEGAITARGERAGRAVIGRGYLEMTGYRTAR